MKEKRTPIYITNSVDKTKPASPSTDAAPIALDTYPFIHTCYTSLDMKMSKRQTFNNPLYWQQQYWSRASKHTYQKSSIQDAV